MAIEIISGEVVNAIDLSPIADTEELYGVGLPQPAINLGWIDKGEIYGITIFDVGDDVALDLGYVDEDVDIYAPQVLLRPPISWRRIQLDGGGRKLLRGTLGDEAVEHFFELWKDGRTFPLVGASPPVFVIRRPSGTIVEAVSRIEDGNWGRIAVQFGTLDERGYWQIQLKFVERLNFDGYLPGDKPPYSPPSPTSEFWRQLPEPLQLLVSDGGGWSV